MLFSGKIRCDRETRKAFFTSDANHREYRLIYGDATSSPNPTEEAYYIVAGRNGQRVSFDGEVNDVDGESIRLETSLRPVSHPPDIHQGVGMLA